MRVFLIYEFFSKSRTHNLEDEGNFPIQELWSLVQFLDMRLFFKRRTHWLKERLGSQEERPWNTNVNVYGDNYPSPLPFTQVTIRWVKGNTKTFWGLLDTGSKLTLTLRNQKHHSGPTIRIAMEGGQIINNFIPGPPHNEFIGSRDLPSGHFSGPPKI